MAPARNEDLAGRESTGDQPNLNPEVSHNDGLADEHLSQGIGQSESEDSGAPTKQLNWVIDSKYNPEQILSEVTTLTTEIESSP